LGAIDFNLDAPNISGRNGTATRRAYFGEGVGMVETTVLGRAEIDGTMQGPLLIDEYDSTTVVPPGARVTCDEYANIVMEFA
jgi:N-methylhydantoinase A